MSTYDFAERLAFSIQANGRPFEKIIADTLPGVISVEPTDVAIDKTGIDFKAHLRRGAPINIDLKLRDFGCKKYWKQGEEITLEIWSVKPTKGNKGRAGWTLDESKLTHYTLHAYDIRDSGRVYLLPFQLLRKAFRTHFHEWLKEYKRDTQNSGKWESECVFVPAVVVLDALREVSVIQNLDY